jgi:hypothetical protein
MDASHEGEVERPGRRQVVEEASLAAEQRPVLDAKHATPDHAGTLEAAGRPAPGRKPAPACGGFPLPRREPVEDTGAVDEQAVIDALARIRAACETLLEADGALFVNFAVRTLAEVRAVETQLPGLEPPPHLLEVE